MSRWRKKQKELIDKAVKQEKSDVQQKDVHSGKVYGTVYFKPKAKYSKGVLLVGGISGNRHSLAPLAKKLTELGYFCFSIDLPSHYKNTNPLTVGELSEEITEAVRIMRDSYGVRRVAIVGHSLGAIGSLLSIAGYNNQIESRLHRVWNRIVELIELECTIIDRKTQNIAQFKKIHEQIELLYVEMKQLILNSLKQGIRSTSIVTCYIFLAPPRNIKNVFPGAKLFRTVSQKLVIKLMTEFFHKPAVKQIYKENNPVDYAPDDKPQLQWQFFKTNDASEFFNYFLNVREVPDFLKLVENLSKFRATDDKVTFFQYYQRRYLLEKPKLFIYGSNDFYLRAFTPWSRRGLEKFYENCGNAEVFRGNFSHVIVENPKQQAAAVSITNEAVIRKIMMFLSKNL